MNKTNYRKLAEWSGWVSAIAFVLGVVGVLTAEKIIFTSDNLWQASLYLALFAIFANLSARE